MEYAQLYNFSLENNGIQVPRNSIILEKSLEVFPPGFRPRYLDSLSCLFQEYIKQISSQVVALLDEKDVLLQSSGVHIISFMAIRHAELVRQFILQPIQSPFLPSKDQMSGAISIISTDEAIEKTLQRLVVVTTNPSPQLISLLMQPLILNLFLLSVYTQNTFHANLRAQTIQLLESYFKSSSSSVTDALHLVERLLWTTTSEGWTYSAGDHGGIAIRRVESGDVHELGFDDISARVSTIIEITRGASNDMKSEIFVGIIRQWLSPHDEDPLSYDPPKYLVNLVHLRMLNYCRSFCRIMKLNY